MTTKILLAEDHTIVRDGLRTLIEETSGMRVAAETADGDSVVRLAKETKPDVILMDVSLKGLDGIEATRRVKADAPRVKVIALSMHSDRRHVAGMLKAGASGFTSYVEPTGRLVAGLPYYQEAYLIADVPIGQPRLAPYTVAGDWLPLAAAAALFALLLISLVRDSELRK